MFNFKGSAGSPYCILCIKLRQLKKLTVHSYQIYLSLVWVCHEGALSGAVIAPVTVKPECWRFESRSGLSMWCLNVLLMSAQVFSSFLPQSKRIRLKGDTKMLLMKRVSQCDGLCDRPSLDFWHLFCHSLPIKWSSHCGTKHSSHFHSSRNSEQSRSESWNSKGKQMKHKVFHMERLKWLNFYRHNEVK